MSILKAAMASSDSVIACVGWMGGGGGVPSDLLKIDVMMKADQKIYRDIEE